MFAAAVIIFREVFEISLLLSVIMAATREISGRSKILIFGLGGGALGASLVAYFAGEISNMAEGMGQELFNAVILFAAASMIGWTVIWMSRHARELSQHIKRLGQDIVKGEATIYSMAIVIALAVLREGSEIVLFIYGMLASKQAVSEIVAGSFIGFSGGAIAGLLLYLGLIKISPKHIFGITSWLLVFLCAGMASIGVSYVIAAGYLSDFSNVLWDTSGIVSESSVPGKALHILLGYSERPMLAQVVIYAAVFSTLSVGIKLTNKKKAA